MMKRFAIPSWVQRHQIRYEADSDAIRRIAKGLARFHPKNVENPDASIVIPAYNEELNLLSMLSSLSELKTDFQIELIVVNNNSTDKSSQILDDCGVFHVFEERQGISYTRQTGFENARGRIYLSADSDSLYPERWADTMIQSLDEQDVSCAYGVYSFIPGPRSNRLALGLYELAAELIFSVRKWRNKEYINVMGFNFAFRREQGKEVGGFNTRRQRWQDGWMALELSRLGKLKKIYHKEARVWTSDRRLITDGSLLKAFTRRVRVNVRRVLSYKKKNPLQDISNSSDQSTS
jgi:glycosyltransferase involved in cell wall biosynthesis